MPWSDLARSDALERDLMQLAALPDSPASASSTLGHYRLPHRSGGPPGEEDCGGDQVLGGEPRPPTAASGRGGDGQEPGRAGHQVCAAAAAASFSIFGSGCCAYLSSGR